MNHPDSTENWVRRAEELVCWTGRERLRFVWYLFRLTIIEMNYASRRMVELQMALPSKRPTAPPAASKSPGYGTGRPATGKRLWNANVRVDTEGACHGYAPGAVRGTA